MAPAATLGRSRILKPIRDCRPDGGPLPRCGERGYPDGARFPILDACAGATAGGGAFRSLPILDSFHLVDGTGDLVGSDDSDDDCSEGVRRSLVPVVPVCVSFMGVYLTPGSVRRGKNEGGSMTSPGGGDDGNDDEDEKTVSTAGSSVKWDDVLR